MPPPLAFMSIVSPPSTKKGSVLERLAVLSLTALPWIVSVTWFSPEIPPPSAKRPFGATTLARFPLTTLPVIVRLCPNPTEIPPPAASLASGPPASLSRTVVFVSVSGPQVAMPPPAPAAKGQGPAGQGGPKGAVAVGATRLPLITLLLIESVAPGPKSAAGGTRIPPPAANTPAGRKGNAGLELFEPPVTVTPEMLTVGSLSANSAPTGEAGAAALDDRRGGAGADQADALVDRHAATEGAGCKLDHVAVMGRVDRGLNCRVAARLASDAEAGSGSAAPGTGRGEREERCCGEYGRDELEHRSSSRVQHGHR